MKRIIYSNPDGSMAIVIPSPEYAGTMAELAAAVVPDGIAYAVIEHDDIPTDRTFRDAWRLGSDGIDQDIETAKAIWRNKWRATRAKLFEKLDTDMLRAIGSGDSAKIAEIEAKKQALRDVTQTALPDDIDEIKSVWPEILTI